MTLRRVVAWTTVLTFVGLLTASILLGYRDAPFSDLKTMVALGKVDQVEVSGGLEPGDEGYALTEVRWTRGVLGFVAVVVEERPAGTAPESLRADEDVSAVLDRPVVEALRAIREPVTATSGGEIDGGVTWLGWHPPAWAWAGELLALAATFGLLMTGPQPRRATRWAWGWLMVLAPPLGIPAYLLFSQVLVRPQPRPDRPGLTGGWAFLLAVVLTGSVTNATVVGVFGY